MEDKRYFTSYKVQENMYEPISEAAMELPKGFYRPVWDSYNNRGYLVAKKVIMPKLYKLPNKAQNQIIDDIKRFWESEERYRKFGNVYKRNILLYSQPGNGKTSLVNMICNYLIEEYNGIVISIDGTNDLVAYGKVMERVRSIEPNRKIITILEDFESLGKDEYFTSTLLQMLDGNSQLDNIVTFATTNHPEVLEKRFTCRPSRFNLVIEYKKPSAEVRKAYIEMKLSDAGFDINDETIKKDVERYVKKTQGYTFDFVKEVVQGIYVDGFTEVEVFDRLEKLRKKDGKVKVSETNKKIGFTSNEVDKEDEVEEGEGTELPRKVTVVKGFK